MPPVESSTHTFGDQGLVSNSNLSTRHGKLWWKCSQVKPDNKDEMWAQNAGTTVHGCLRQEYGGSDGEIGYGTPWVG